MLSAGSEVRRQCWSNKSDIVRMLSLSWKTPYANIALLAKCSNEQRFNHDANFTQGKVLSS
jgi:hypothetical protein